MKNKEYTILVVEDDLDVLKNLEIELEIEGYHVISAQDSISAFTMLKKQAFDLIVSDIVMPDMDGNMSKRAGIDLLKIIKVNYPNIPVIMLSATENKEIKDEALKLGAVASFEKGPSSTEFKKTIQTYLK